jgi:hypothetical protein
MSMSPRLLRPRATGFNPKSISGLLVWLDAADSSTYTLATGVSEWRDKSGNGRTFTQATANNQPVISSTAQNGKALLEFDGVNDRLQATGNWLQIANCTLFAAFRRTSGNYGGIIASAGNSDASPGIIIEATNSAVRGYNNLSLFGVYSSFSIACGTVSAGATIARTNGTQVDSDVVSGTLDTTQTTTTIGTYRQAAANYFGGYIGEIIAWNKVLSDAEITTVTRYLGKKWGITVA